MIKSSRAWRVKLNHCYYRLSDQRIPCLLGCLGELTILEKYSNVVMHVIHTTIAILWPFQSGSEAEVSTLLKYLNQDIE